MINLETLRLLCVAAVILIVGLLGANVCLAQDKSEQKKSDEFCQSWNSGDRSSYNEVREYTVASSGSVTVDGGMNGGVSVIGEDRNDVFIRACIQGQAKTDEEARSLVKSINIQTGGVIKAEGPADAAKGWGENKGWGVSFRIHVPRNMDLKLTTHNGGIKIGGVNGNMEFSALNGGIKLNEISGNVKGRTTNGGVKIELGGNGWRGSGLDVQTTNGGIHVTVPKGYAANVETGTVNGGFVTDIESLRPLDTGEKRGHRPTRVNAPINGGGAPIRVVTTNGGVKITELD